MVAHHGWLVVRDRALAGLAQRPALVVVEGAAGTGKTVLLHELARVLRDGGISAHFVASGSDRAGLAAAEANSVLLIDDAGQLDQDVLVSLTRDGGRLLVLSDRPGTDGRPGLAERLGDTCATPTWLRLQPLEEPEVAAFLAASLPPTDRFPDVFDAAAIASLARRSAGVPRLVHDLAATALFLADRELATQVQARHVDQAALVGETGSFSTLLTPPTAIPLLPEQVAVHDDRPPMQPALSVPMLKLATPSRRSRVRPLYAAVAVACIAGAVAGYRVWSGATAEALPVAGPAAAVADSPHGTAMIEPDASRPLPSLRPAPAPSPTSTAPPPPQSAAARSATPEPAIPEPAVPAPAISVPEAPHPETPAPVSRVLAAPTPPSLATTSTAPPSTAPTPLAPTPLAPTSTAPPWPVPSPPVPLEAPPVMARTPPPLVVKPPSPLPSSLPAGAFATVTIAYPQGNAAAATLAASLARGLRADGFTVPDPAASAARQTAGIHYAFAEDRDAAVEVAAAVHRLTPRVPAAALRVGTDGSNSAARPGAVQIMLSGEGDPS